MQVADIDGFRDVRDLDIAPDGAWVAYTVGLRRRRPRQGRRRRLAVELGRHRARPADHQPGPRDRSRASAPTASGSRSCPGGKSGDDDKTTGGQIWLLNRQGGEARRLTDPQGRRQRLPVVARFDAAGRSSATTPIPRRTRPATTRRRRSRSSSTATASSATATATWSHRRSHLYLLNVATGAVETLTSRRLGRRAAGVVAGRHADRLRQRPRRRRRSHQRHQRLRRRRQGRRRSRGRSRRGTAPTTRRGRRGAPTARRSPTSRAASRSFFAYSRNTLAVVAGRRRRAEAAHRRRARSTSRRRRGRRTARRST